MRKKKKVLWTRSIVQWGVFLHQLYQNLQVFFQKSAPSHAARPRDMWERPFAWRHLKDFPSEFLIWRRTNRDMVRFIFFRTRVASDCEPKDACKESRDTKCYRSDFHPISHVVWRMRNRAKGFLALCGLKGKGAAARGHERWIVYCVTGRCRMGEHIYVPENLTMTERCRACELLDLLGWIVWNDSWRVVFYKHRKCKLRYVVYTGCCIGFSRLSPVGDNIQLCNLL